MPAAASELIPLLRAGDFDGIRASVKSDPAAARRPRPIVEAGRLANQRALALFVKAGADLNAAFRGYRALHALLQEDPHAAAGKPARERRACLDWMLAHGADPEQTGAWPPARAIVIAAFVGSPEYVSMLRQGGARIDGFAAAALGDRKRVEKDLAAHPDFAHARDAGGLTALQCAAGSRMPKADCAGIARILLDAGAEVAAKTRSWSHDIDALQLAAGTRNRAVFDLLLERGADATEGLAHALWSAAYDLAESALAHGAVIDRARANDKPLLNDMVCWGQIAQAMWLLERGASPNLADDARGWTAVHQAASRGNARLLRAVLDAGGEPRRRDKAGHQPRDLARAPKIGMMLA
jgi:ankyrin repeat protein